ncbi:MAG TPA: hypothetical protein VGI08_10335 [Diaminobutyricibacter sp.]|jgi:hypothetical protein
MKRNVYVVALTGLMTLVAGLLTATPAVAATPPQVIHTKVNVTLTGIDQCGFTVNSVITGTDTFKITIDASGTASYQEESHVVSTLTNVANGKVVYVDSAGRNAFSDGGVLNPDGTTTFTDTLTGRDTRIYTSHSSVLLKDVGYLAIIDTVDSDGNLLSQQLLVHGPHEYAGDDTAKCDAMTAAIG